MRIVAGEFKGRRLQAPDGRDLRPTSDRVREAVFNILLHGLEAGIEGVSVIDAFAGTGAMGLEALSRGAGHATFLEESGEAIRFIRRNAGAVGAASQATILKMDVTSLPAPPLVSHAPCEVVFLDPPYGSGLAGPALDSLFKQGWIASESICVLEIAAKDALTPPPGFNVL
ncbi:MAG: 16S rRNA (guanine(966)-N(2))-methyltransferase RsmD, partial [Rhodospirillales bacterium]|nr:16S rRNA (guanine(966)-N(2))-methyltransferase RsmD [Rhodospirillales bacterium]